MKYAGLFILGLFTLAVQAQWREERTGAPADPSTTVQLTVDAAVEEAMHSLRRYDLPQNSRVQIASNGRANRAFADNKWYRNGRKRR